MVRAIATLGLLVVAVSALIWAFQRQLMYLPSQDVPTPPPGVDEVSFATDDGLELEAWFVRPSNPLATLIVFNGNAGNRSGRLPLAATLSAEGYAVLLVDYRGYGGNPGSPTESGLVSDARGALAYVRGRDDVDPDRVVYFGESLGAGVAAGLAVEEIPAALVLRSPFPSLGDVGRIHYPFLPVSLLLRDRFPVRDQIAEVAAPVMVILGTDDDIVPADLSREVFAAAADPKRLLTVEGVGHNDLDLLAGEQMVEGIAGFLRSNVP